MEIYDNERDQSEVLRKWWKENGVAVIAGLVIGIGGLVGWQSWQAYSESRSAQASLLYEQVVGLSLQGDLQQARRLGEELAGEYGGTAYAALGGLTLARHLVGAGDLEAAEGVLRGVMEDAPLEELRVVARLRTAQVLLARKRPEEALALLGAEVPESFRGAYAELRGDILRVQGDRAGARAAYQEALAHRVSSANQELLRMKLADLGAAADGEGAGQS